MHQSSLEEMRRILDRFLDRDAPLRVLDVGSAIVPGSLPTSYREFMSPCWSYTGCDIEPGNNVDLVMSAADRIADEGDAYDVVLSGQCLEHVPHPQRLVTEMARMCKPGGLIIVTAPASWPQHRYPADYWRFLPDGMWLLLETAGLRVVWTWLNEHDCWGIGRKPPC